MRAMRRGTGPWPFPSRTDPMAYDSGNRLLLCTLVKGLGDAVRRDDPSAAQRYRRRLRLATEQISADVPVHDVFERLLYTSGQWVAAAERSCRRLPLRRTTHTILPCRVFSRCRYGGRAALIIITAVTVSIRESRIAVLLKAARGPRPRRAHHAMACRFF